LRQTLLEKVSQNIKQIYSKNMKKIRAGFQRGATPKNRNAFYIFK
jgi:hypothetical protein